MTCEIWGEGRHVGPRSGEELGGNSGGEGWGKGYGARGDCRYG